MDFRFKGIYGSHLRHNGQSKANNLKKKMDGSKCSSNHKQALSLGRKDIMLYTVFKNWRYDVVGQGACRRV